MVLIPNTTGVESANTNVIGRRSPVARYKVSIIAKKYRNNLVANRRAHWSLKTRCGMLPSNITRERKKPPVRFFFKALASVLSLMA